jgi:23S rRNA pseudouridine1911/1915/1917 synthase
MSAEWFDNGVIVGT